MSILGVVFLGLVGLLGAYLYLITGSEHRQQTKARDLEHTIQVERFDRDFERAWNGQKLQDHERPQRLHTLEEQAATQKTHAEQNTQATNEREQALRRALDQLSGFKEKGQP